MWQTVFAERMKNIFIIICCLFTVGSFGQNKPTKKAQPIVAEGKLLYKSEMASWYGTDLFLENYDNRENVGGYFSYSEKDSAKCIFYSKDDIPLVIGTISFDSTYNVESAQLNLTERIFTDTENDLYQIRKRAFAELQSNVDGFFKFYENTNPNLIPLIEGDEKKVYILTGPQQSGVVIFGNDYLLTFDKNNEVATKKTLHKNIIPIQYGPNQELESVEGSVHSHLPETGEFITATDICTLMLYGKFTDWKTHNVVSEKYLNIWNCKTNQLTVISMDVIEKIDKDLEKRNQKKEKKE